MKMLKHAFGHNRGKKSWDYTCKTGCRSEQGVLHDKIYLFEHTGGAKDVVMTGLAQPDRQRGSSTSSTTSSSRTTSRSSTP